MGHLWHEIAAGPNPPDVIHAVIETPHASHNQYAYHPETGLIHFERTLFDQPRFPGDYGFIPQSISEANHALKIIVVTREATFPGCVIEVRPLGMLHVVCGSRVSQQIVGVPYTSTPEDGREIMQFREQFLDTLKRYAQMHGTRENDEINDVAWADDIQAKKTILMAVAHYRTVFPSSKS